MITKLKIKVLITFLFLSTLIYGNEMSSLWEFKRDTGVSKTWKLKGHSGVYASLTETKNINSKSIKAILDRDDYLKSIERKKKGFLGLFGAQDWKKDKHTWKKVNGNHLLEVKGFYKDSKNESVSFIEVHYFKDKKIVQMLYIKPKKLKLDSKYHEAFFKEFM